MSGTVGSAGDPNRSFEPDEAEAVESESVGAASESMYGILYVNLMNSLILILTIITSAFRQESSRGDTTARPLLYAERRIHFSSGSSDDLFSLTGKGRDTLHAKILFVIVSSNGDTLFAESFRSRDLIGYGVLQDDNGKVTQAKERFYIGQRVTHFFDDKEFSLPAVKKHETADPDMTNMRLWNELREDTSAVSFHFLLGEENNRAIAYSKVRKRVEILHSYD